MPNLLPYLIGGLGGGYAWKHKDQIKKFLLGTEPKMEKFNTLSWNQRHYLRNLLGQLKGQNIDLGESPLYQSGSEYLQDLLSPTSGAYDRFSAPMMSEFQQQILPSIAERFAGLGGLSSSGFEQASTQAGQNLAERLAALRSGLQMQGAQMALPYAQAPAESAYRYGALALGTPAFGYTNTPGQQGFLQGMAPGLGRGLTGLFASGGI